MDLLTALASLAAQHPSTPIDLGIEFEADAIPPWQAQLTMFLSEDEQPTIAFGEGNSSAAALEDLLQVLIRIPCR